MARGTGIFIFDRSREKFTPFKPGTSMKLDFVAAFAEDRKKKIWMANSEGELATFDKLTGKFSFEEIMKAFSKDLELDIHPRFKHLYNDSKNILWISGNRGLHQVEIIPGSKNKPSRMHFTHYHPDSTNANSLSARTIRCVYEDHSGVIWIGTGKGLNSLNTKTGNIIRYLHDDDDARSISNDHISSITEDKDGNIWVGTNTGLNKLSKNRNGFTRYLHDESDPASLSNNLIFSMVMGNSDILWISTGGGGISKLDLKQMPIALYRNNYLDINSLSSNKVSAILEDKAGIIWIGTVGGGLNAWNKKTNKFAHYRTDPTDTTSLGSDLVSAILRTADGTLWVGTGKNSVGILSKFDPLTGKFIHYRFKYSFNNVGENPILSLYEDSKNTIWVGSTNGMIHFYPTTQTWQHYPYDVNNPEGLTDYWVNTICEDGKGNLWIGHNSHALVKFNPGTGKYKHYIHDPHDTTSISSSIVKRIFKDSKGVLWFATRHGGLCRLNQENETFTTFSKKDGLPSNTVYSILKDNEGYLWLTTNKGLSRFSPLTASFKNFNTDDGLQSNQFEVEIEVAGACYKGSDGTLYFGGPNGLNAFDPRSLQSDHEPPAIVITKLKLFDKLLPGMNEAEKIILNYDQNFFSIEFAALNYANSTKNQYAYQLVGVDKELVFSGARRIASYTKIDPGTYSFIVKASNSDGVWNEKGIRLTIVIRPPWWATWWFYTLAAIVSVGLIYFLIQVYIRRKFEKKIILLEKRQAVELERMRISSDLHDDVGGELSAIRLLSEMNVSNTSPQQQLSKISLSSGELIKKLNEIVWALNMSNDNLQSLLSYNRRYAVKYLDDMGITCHFNQPEDIIDLHIDGNTRRNIFLLVKEALNNIIKHAAASEVNIDIYIDYNLCITVHDNGKGFSFDMMHTATGNGLRNMQQRVKDLNGSFEIKNSPGTTLIFLLPVFNSTKV